MRNFILATTVLAACTLASAQLQTAAPAPDPKVVSPTTVDGADQYSKGSDTASVTQTVHLKLPRATALHLDVKDLSFDLSALNGTNWGADGPNVGSDFGGKMVCVYGNQTTDVVEQLSSPEFYGQTQTKPLGTSYDMYSWPKIKVNGGDVVTSYPPIQIGANGELKPGSKNYFVCYRSFILQKFSNGGRFDLTVTRSDAGSDVNNINHLYIQDNPCYAGTAAQAPATGLFELKAGAPALHLLPVSLQTGPTGTRSDDDNARCGYKSWLDDLVVMAVKVNGDRAGDNTATVTYTLTTLSWPNADIAH
ncbi:hypothetical protein [Deinococcus pimensis]|uniref:hypothetical protein n=1 Tax=Deinococcus pimensis TaxID=309888 RepID=UPI000487F6A4|nr:hypothetical protein [Deinococcus pimensis]